MDEYELYREKVPSTWLTLILVFSAFLVLAIPGIVYLTGDLEELPILTAIYLALVPGFFFLAYNFSSLDILVTNLGIQVSYGIFKKYYPFNMIRRVRKDTHRAMKYGGFGIRMNRINDKRWLVYNVIGGERVVLDLIGDKYDCFCFSVKSAEDVMMYIERELSRK